MAGETSTFTRCQDPTCDECNSPTCLGLRDSTSPSLLSTVNVCKYCDPAVDLPFLCTRQGPCPGWSPGEQQRFQDQRVALSIVSPAQAVFLQSLPTPSSNAAETSRSTPLRRPASTPRLSNRDDWATGGGPPSSFPLLHQVEARQGDHPGVPDAPQLDTQYIQTLTPRVVRRSGRMSEGRRENRKTMMTDPVEPIVPPGPDESDQPDPHVVQQPAVPPSNVAQGGDLSHLGAASLDHPARDHPGYGAAAISPLSPFLADAVDFFDQRGVPPDLKEQLLNTLEKIDVLGREELPEDQYEAPASQTDRAGQRVAPFPTHGNIPGTWRQANTQDLDDSLMELSQQHFGTPEESLGGSHRGPGKTSAQYFPNRIFHPPPQLRRPRGAPAVPQPGGAVAQTYSILKPPTFVPPSNGSGCRGAGVQFTPKSSLIELEQRTPSMADQIRGSDQWRSGEPDGEKNRQHSEVERQVTWAIPGDSSPSFVASKRTSLPSSSNPGPRHFHDTPSNANVRPRRRDLSTEYYDQQATGFNDQQANGSNHQPGGNNHQPGGENHTQNQIIGILELLTKKLVNERNPPAPSSSNLRLPTMSLPTPRREHLGTQVGTKAFYTWKHALLNTMRTHQLPPETLLTYYSTNEKLPASWLEAFCNSSTLQEGLDQISTTYPPIDSLHSELTHDLTSLPALENCSEKGRVARINKLLTHLSDFRKFFGNYPALDLRRESCIIILHHLCGDNGKPEMVRYLSDLDHQRTNGTLYMDSLAYILVRIRLSLIDIVSALTLVPQQPRTRKSAAIKVVSEKTGGGDKGPVGAKGARPGEKKSCPICKKEGKEFHPSFLCPELPEIKAGKKKLPHSVCRVCLHPRDTGHPQNCHLKRIFKNGVYQVLNTRCDQHKTHVHLCSCGKRPAMRVDENQEPPVLKARSAAIRHEVVREDEAPGGERVQDAEEDAQRDAERVHHQQSTPEQPSTLLMTAPQLTRDEDHLHPALPAQAPRQFQQLLRRESSAAVGSPPDEYRVIFLAEKALVLNQDNSTSPIYLSYDSHGTLDVLGGKEIEPQSNWAAGEEMQNIQIQTIHGSLLQQHRVFTIKLVTLGGIVDLKVYKGEWEGSDNEAQVSIQQAEKWGVDLPATGIADMPRIILSAAHLLLHPRLKGRQTEELKKHQPYLGVFQSLVTGRSLCGGRLSTD